jgi:hypothetical protein
VVPAAAAAIVVVEESFARGVEASGLGAQSVGVPSLLAQGAKLGDRALELGDSRVHVFSLYAGINFRGKRRHKLSERFELALQLQGEGRSNAALACLGAYST